MTDQPPGGYPPPQPPQSGGYPPPQPPQSGGYPPPPPPQSGGYPPPPPPQSGGYPPPPPPQSGGYPPPPQSGGYLPPAGGYPPAGGPGYGTGYDVGEAFKWAWNKFTKYAGPLIVATLVYALIAMAVQFLVGLAQAALSPDASFTSYGTGFSYSFSSFSAVGIIMSAIGSIVTLLVSAAIQSAYVSGVLDIANGREVSFGSFFRPRNIGNILIAGLIVSVLTAVGFILCIIPGIIVAILTMYTYIALLDRNLSPVDAIKASVDVYRAHVGEALLAFLIYALILVVGLLACGVGLIVAAPIATLFLVYTYRRLNGVQVAPLTP